MRARTVILDNEAVQALLDPSHRKHRRVLAKIEVVASRNLRAAGSVRLVVPTTVRVEAGWDRRSPGAAIINRLRVHDSALDTGAADAAARVRASLGVSAADGHIVAVLGASAAPHTVVTSDIEDMRRLAGQLGLEITAARV